MWYLLTSLNSKSIRTIIFILTLFVGQIVVAQDEKTIVHRSNFYFYYAVVGLGSNLGSFQPTLRVYNNKFTYTKEQNSYRGRGNRSEKVEFISKGFLRQSSIDSILTLVQGLKDSTIYKTNPCIMSGAIIYITITQDSDTIKFTLHNTFDLTALKIIDIINPYLPKDKKLYGSKDDIKEEEDCWAYLRDQIKQQIKDSTKGKQ